MQHSCLDFCTVLCMCIFNPIVSKNRRKLDMLSPLTLCCVCLTSWSNSYVHFQVFLLFVLQELLYDASQFAIEPRMSGRRLVVCNPRWRGGSITSVHFPLSSASRAAVEFLKIQVIKVTLVKFNQPTSDISSTVVGSFSGHLLASMVCLKLQTKCLQFSLAFLLVICTIRPFPRSWTCRKTPTDLFAWFNQLCTFSP